MVKISQNKPRRMSGGEVVRVQARVEISLAAPVVLGDDGMTCRF
jgi:hypothetical protein